MARGHLSKSDLLKIEQALPSLEELEKLVPSTPDFISISLPHDSWVPVASVCLRDAYDTIADARYAMHESLAHELWHKKRSERPDEMSAVYFARYYLDDAAFRLYSAGEHLANAIVLMMEIPREGWRSFRKRNRSFQVTIGKYLMEKKPGHTITQELGKLISHKEWDIAGSYRNRLVHDQPPSVVGLGLTYLRQRRWVPSVDGKTWTLRLGGGDKSEYTMQQIQETFRQALADLISFAAACCRFYRCVLSDKGIQFVDDR